MSIIHVYFLCIFTFFQSTYLGNGTPFPIVINTWNFVDANKIAFARIMRGNSALDAVEIGCRFCETMQCDGTVGYGGSPDETGETTLDAMIMDGKTMNAGAVGALRNIKNAVSVARYVLEYTEHTFLVGSQATEFAIQMGFHKEPLSTSASKKIWKDWQANNCQPNFWINVSPDSKQSCGPYQPLHNVSSISNLIGEHIFDSHNHDTIGMVAIDKNGNIAVATSTNGARHKIPGRIGDSPIIGSGGYAENGIGGAAATGDGDILMRFLPSFKAVEGLKYGLSPTKSATVTIENIMKYYPKFVGAVVVVSANGEFGAACHGIKTFPFSVSHGDIHSIRVIEIDCLDSAEIGAL